MKKKTWIILAVIVVLITGIIGISYALWTRAFQQTGNNLVYSDCFKITFEDQNDIHLDNAIPMSKEELQKYFFPTAVPYHFTVTNQCELLTTASINLETLPVEGKKLGDEYVNLILYDGTKSILETSSYYTKRSMDLISHPLNNENKVIPEAINAYSLYNFKLKPNEVREFNLLLFLDEDTPAIEEVVEAEWSSKITVSVAYKRDLSGTNTLAERGNLSFANYSGSTTKIVIQNTIEPITNAIATYDESIGQTDSVKSYIVENEKKDESEETTHTVYLQANGAIYLPANSSELFKDFRKLVTIEGMENLDTINVTNMEDMFLRCIDLTSLDVSNFNTIDVTTMSSMFEGCTSLTNLDVSNFDTRNVTDMASMFKGCFSLTNLDLSNFDTSNVTYMGAMFSRCSSLTSLDLSHFDTSKVTEMGSMFRECTSLTSLDVSHFDTSNVTNMSDMFEECSSLTNLDLSNFDTSNVTEMGWMFRECSSLTSLNLSNFNTSNEIHMLAMFEGCSSLTSLNLSSFDTSRVKSMGSMFSGCSSLVTIIYGSNFVRPNNVIVDNMYDDCPANKPTDASWDGLF